MSGVCVYYGEDVIQSWLNEVLKATRWKILEFLGALSGRKQLLQAIFKK